MTSLLGNRLATSPPCGEFEIVAFQITVCYLKVIALFVSLRVTTTLSLAIPLVLFILENVHYYFTKKK